MSVNWGRYLKTNEPFVLANQVSQVFYTSDNFNKGWCVAWKIHARDTYELVQQIDNDVTDLKNSTQNKIKEKETTEVKYLHMI